MKTFCDAAIYCYSLKALAVATAKIGDCRYGPASVIINHQPIVIPIRINGMNEVMPINIGFKWQKIKRGKKYTLHVGPAINFSVLYPGISEA